MANFYSDGVTKIRAGRALPANEMYGKVRVVMWDFASLTANTLADVFVCGPLKKGQRVIQGKEFHTALTSGAGTATASYGTYAVLNDGITIGAVDDVDRYLTATSLEAAGQNDLASLQASPQGVGTGPLHEASAALFICCTNSVEAFATAGRLSGYLLVVGD